MGSTVDITSSFIEGAPPGELQDVVKDIKALTSDNDPALIAKLKPAFQKYNEEQLVAVKLPGATDHVLISPYNRVPSSSRYYDTSSSTSFEFDHTTSKASNSESYTHETQHSDLVQSILKSLSAHFAEHYPPASQPQASSGYTVAATPEDDKVAILLSTTRSSPKNFLSGRWRSTFLYNPSSSTLSGTIKVNVHYYEDGNVALATTKKVEDVSLDSGGIVGASVVRKIAAIEKQYQEEVNRAFVGMNESSFKALRRQLPVTRQKIEWERVRGYGLGGDLRGEAKR